MKKVSKAILIALGILLALGALAVLGVNLYIQSAPTQASLQRGLGRALHTPVKIASVSFTPWYGVRLTGITGPGVDAADGGNAIQISKVSMRLKLWKLMLRKVIIKDLTVEGAKVAWNQTPEGKWLFPGQIPAPKPPVPTATPATTDEAQPQPSPEIQPPTQPQPVAPTPAPAHPGFDNTVQVPVTINRFRLRDSSFDFYDKNHKQIVTASGINAQSFYPSPQAVNGSANLSRIAVQNLFFMRNCQTDFIYSPAQVSLLNARTTIAGGTSVGSLTVRVAQSDSPFNFDVKFSDIEIGQLLSEAGISESDVEVTGSLSGFLHLQGNLRSSEAASGKGQFSVTNGRISKLQLFDELADLLHSDRVRQFNLQEVLVNYHIGDGKIYVDGIDLKASDLALTGQGIIEMAGGALALKCRITIGPEITRRIPDFLMENFGRDEPAHARYLDFDVFGTLGNPRTDLLKLIGNDIEHGAKSIWKSLFGKKTPAFAPPTPMPTPAPVPTPAQASTPATPAPPAATASPTP